MRMHPNHQRQSRKSKRQFSHREGIMPGVGEKRPSFQQPGLLPQPSLGLTDGMPSYPHQPLLTDSSSTPLATLGGGLPSTPTMGYNTYNPSNSYHTPSVTSGTPTTPSTPSMNTGLALHGLGHGVSQTLLRGPATTLHTTNLQHFGNHAINGSLNGLHQTYPSAPNPQQSALVQSPMADRATPNGGLHAGLSVSTPTSHGPLGPSNGHSNGPGRLTGLGGPANLSASVPHAIGRPPPPPAPIPPIPVPALPCATITTPTAMEAGTPTSGGPPSSLPVLSGPSPLHGGGQHLIQLPQPTYSQDRIPFDLDYPPHGLYFRCLLDAKLVGGLIGKKGQSIEHIRKQSGAKIHIAKKFPNQQPIMRLVTVSGQCKQVVEALQLIADKLASAEQDAVTSGSGEPSHGVTLLVDEKNVGCLIGKNGNTINGIRKKTGANVFISSHLMPHSSEKCIDLSGSKTSVDQALEAICQQFLSNPKFVHTRNEYNPQASLFATSAYMYPMGSLFSHPLGRNDLVDAGFVGSPCSPNGQTMTVQYLVEKSHIGGIIGRGGRNIAEIRRQSQANVTIDNDQQNDHRTVTLRGTRQEIHLALSLLQHAIAINHPPRETRG